MKSVNSETVEYKLFKQKQKQKNIFFKVKIINHTSRAVRNYQSSNNCIHWNSRYDVLRRVGKIFLTLKVRNFINMMIKHEENNIEAHNNYS